LSTNTESQRYYIYSEVKKHEFCKIRYIPLSVYYVQSNKEKRRGIREQKIEANL
jgi:hypothetical protein